MRPIQVPVISLHSSVSTHPNSQPSPPLVSFKFKFCSMMHCKKRGPVGARATAAAWHRDHEHDVDDGADWADSDRDSESPPPSDSDSPSPVPAPPDSPSSASRAASGVWAASLSAASTGSAIPVSEATGELAASVCCGESLGTSELPDHYSIHLYS